MMAIQLADQFSQTFRQEHRGIRDTLLDLVQAFQQRDIAWVRTLLQQTAVLTGPHFRYEEEAMYPALVAIFGEEYVDKLLGDHDRAIGSARRLVALAGQDTLTDDEVREAVHLVRGLLPHVSDCDGLSIMVERLPDSQIHTIFAARERSRKADLDLLAWASTIRARPAIAPAPLGPGKPRTTNDD